VEDFPEGFGAAAGTGFFVTVDEAGADFLG